MTCVNAGKRVGWADEVKVYMEKGQQATVL